MSFLPHRNYHLHCSLFAAVGAPERNLRARSRRHRRGNLWPSRSLDNQIGDADGGVAVAEKVTMPSKYLGQMNPCPTSSPES